MENQERDEYYIRKEKNNWEMIKITTITGVCATIIAILYLLFEYLFL